MKTLKILNFIFIPINKILIRYNYFLSATIRYRFVSLEISIKDDFTINLYKLGEKRKDNTYDIIKIKNLIRYNYE
jgi:hypothetical protein